MSEICPKCGLPTELCVCETIAKENQKIRIYSEKRKFGKKYTIVEGIDDKSIDMKDVVKKLKSKFACGGTSKGNSIELQGDHLAKLKSTLIELGFPAETIEQK
jgi:translation initiation factor 1